MAEAARRYMISRFAMARYISRRAVEAEIRRQGLKLQTFSCKELMGRADEYLKQHPELIDQARVTIAALEQERLTFLSFTYPALQPLIYSSFSTLPSYFTKKNFEFPIVNSMA